MIEAKGTCKQYIHCARHDSKHYETDTFVVSFEQAHSLLFSDNIGESHEAVLLTAGLGRRERTSRGRQHRRNEGRMGRPAYKVHRGHEVASTGSGGRAKKKHMSQG